MPQATPCQRKNRKPPGWVLYLLARYSTVIEAIPFWLVLFAIMVATTLVIALGVLLLVVEAWSGS